MYATKMFFSNFFSMKWLKIFSLDFEGSVHDSPHRESDDYQNIFYHFRTVCNPTEFPCNQGPLATMVFCVLDFADFVSL